MSYVISSLWNQAKKVGYNVASAAVEYPLISTTVGLSSTALTIYYTRKSALYQRYHTVIKALAVLSSLGGGYALYVKFKPYIDELLRAKELIENSNPKRMFIPQDQLKVIESTSHHAFIVTLDALQSSLVQTFQTRVIRSLILRHTKQSVGGVFINYYKTAILAQTAASVILTSIVHHFNAVSVGVTFRFSDSDRRMMTAVAMQPQQEQAFGRLVVKLNQYYGQLVYYSDHVNHLRLVNAKLEQQTASTPAPSASTSPQQHAVISSAQTTSFVVPTIKDQSDNIAYSSVIKRTADDLFTMLTTLNIYKTRIKDDTCQQLSVLFPSQSQSEQTQQEEQTESDAITLPDPLPPIASLLYTAASDLQTDIITVVNAQKLNTHNDSVQLQTLLHSAVTDSLNLIYQSTLTVLFPVVAQIAADVAFESCYIPTPYSAIKSEADYLASFKAGSYSGVDEESPEAMAHLAQTDHEAQQRASQSTKESPNILRIDPWFGTLCTSDDLSVVLDSVTNAVFNILLTPSPWMVRFTQPQRVYATPDTQEKQDSNDSSVTNDMTSTQQDGEVRLVETVLPISDYVLSYGYGRYVNSVFRTDPSDPNTPRFFHSSDDASQSSLTTLQPKSEVHSDFLQRQYGFPSIEAMLSPVFTNTTTQSQEQRAASTQDSPISSFFSSNTSTTSSSEHDNAQDIPLLAHLLLPISPLLNAVAKRVEQLPHRQLNTQASSLGILTLSSVNLVNNMGMDLFGSGQQGGGSSLLNSLTNPGGTAQQAATPPGEESIRLDSKEIYIRRVLQVIGELFSVMTCKSIYNNYPREVSPSSNDDNLDHPTASPFTDPLVRALHPYHMHGVAATEQTPTASTTQNGDADGVKISLTPDDADADDDSPGTLVATSPLLSTVYNKSKNYAIFYEIYRDTLALLGHTRRQLDEISNNDLDASGAPIPKRLMLYRIHRFAKLYDALLPPYTKVQELQKLLHKPQLPMQQQQQNVCVPDSFPHALKQGINSRQNVSNYIVRVIASSIGVEKDPSNNILDMFGLDEGNMDSLQRLFALGGDDNGFNSNIDDSDDEEDDDTDNSGWFSSITSFLGFGSSEPKPKVKKQSKQQKKKPTTKRPEQPLSEAEEFDRQLIKMFGSEANMGLIPSSSSQQKGQNDLMSLLFAGAGAKPGTKKKSAAGKKKGKKPTGKTKTSATSTQGTLKKNPFA